MTEERVIPAVIERRVVSGASAVLLPLTEEGAPDWAGFETHVERTVTAGLVPAINMDTGFGPFLSAGDRRIALGIARSATAESATAEFIAGVHLDDEPGDALDLSKLLADTVEVRESGAIPMLFPGHGSAALDEDALVQLHRDLADHVEELMAFELGPMFHPAGRIFSIRAFEAIMGIDGVIGLKHSSLRRDLEWERLTIRDRVRPAFRLMTGNDLAIDMVIYGSDYLLGLSTFAPDAFAERDAAWAAGDVARFWELNDLLQYLGQFAFRSPVPAYRHDAAVFLKARGWIRSSRTHDRSPVRPAGDADVLDDIATRLERLL